MPAKKVSRIIDVQKNNQLKYNFTGVPETDPRACFNQATWSPTVNLQQPPLGTSHLILGDSLVRVLSNLRTSWVTTVMAFGCATIAQLFQMVELMNPGRIPNVMILVGTNGVFVYDPLAEIQLRGTDRLHCANEYEKPDSIRKKAQRGSRQVE